jgi:hypothetical protein
MSHAAFIAIMNNQTDFFNITGDIEYAFNSLESLFTGILSYFSLILIPFCFSFLREITHVVATRYTEIFGNNHILAYLSLVAVSFTLTYMTNFYKNIFDRLKELEDQVNYAKKKIRMQDGEIEYLLDEKKHNEKKFLTLQKKVQKVNKELKQYE